MKIVVVGCGKIGVTLIESFINEGHEVTAIDENAAVISEISDAYDVRTLCGSGTSYSILSESGIADTDLIVATTGSDESNMLCCFTARKMGAKHTVARIRKTEYTTENLSFMKHLYEISMVINPELLAAELIYNILKLPSAINVEPFARRKIDMAELIVKKGSALDGALLSDLKGKYDARFLVCAVQRENEVYIPGGNFTLKEGDRVGIIAAHSNFHKILRTLGILQKQAKNVMLLGAGKLSYYLAHLLLKGGNDVKIIELDEKVCEEISELLPDEAVIVHGDCMSQELLAEEGLNTSDAVVALTGMDEENILISFYAMSQNLPKVISKVNRESLASLAEKLGLDCIISPRNIASDVVTRYARGLNNSIGSKMETFYRLMDGEVEALEFKVLDDFLFTNTPLKNIKLKNNIIIAGILRGQETIIPGGNDVMLAGDSVIVVAKGTKINELSEIMA